MITNFRYDVVKIVQPYVKYFQQLNKPAIRVLLQVSANYIESSKCSAEVLDLALTKLSNAGHTVPENFCELFAAILQIMQLYLRLPNGSVKAEELNQCLKEDLRLSDECAKDLTNVLHTHGTSLTKHFLEAKMITRSVKNLQWRINVSLMQGKPNEATLGMPTVVIHFQLPDGRYRTLEMPIVIFHRLRYNVGVLLNEMHRLSQRAVMKKF